MKEDLVDLHMLIGDHEWDHGKSKAEAMKAYTAALFPAGELGLEVMIQTGMHSVKAAAPLPAADRIQQIEKLFVVLKTWPQGPSPKEAVRRRRANRLVATAGRPPHRTGGLVIGHGAPARIGETCRARNPGRGVNRLIALDPEVPR